MIEKIDFLKELHYLGAVNFSNIHLISHDNATTVRMIPSGTNSPPAEV